jgi:hypothetical protein
MRLEMNDMADRLRELQNELATERHKNQQLEKIFEEKIDGYTQELRDKAIALKNSQHHNTSLKVELDGTS